MDTAPKILQQSVRIGNRPDKNYSFIDKTQDPKQLVADIIGYSSQQFLTDRLAQETKKSRLECREALDKMSWNYTMALTILQEG